MALVYSDKKRIPHLALRHIWRKIPIRQTTARKCLQRLLFRSSSISQNPRVTVSLAQYAIISACAWAFTRSTNARVSSVQDPRTLAFFRFPIFFHSSYSYFRIWFLTTLNGLLGSPLFNHIYLESNPSRVIATIKPHPASSSIQHNARHIRRALLKRKMGD